MISEKFEGLNQTIFTIAVQPEPIQNIADIAAYNEQEGLALNTEEVIYLNAVSKRIGRPLTDSEVFGFSKFPGPGVPKAHGSPSPRAKK